MLSYDVPSLLLVKSFVVLVFMCCFIKCIDGCRGSGLDIVGDDDIVIRGVDDVVFP